MSTARKDQPLLAAAPRSRWLVAHLPAFRVERCGYGAEELAAVVGELQNATRIVALTPAAREAGLGVGMTASQARALVAGVLLEPVDVVAEAQDRRALITSFGDLCDRVEMWETDDLVLDIAATAGLVGGERALMGRVRERVGAFGHRCGLAVSDHPLAAAALAGRTSDDVWVPPGEGARALAKLPFHALRPSPELLLSAQALGVRTIGAWARLDLASIAGRFGEEGHRLHRVASGLGELAWRPRVVDEPADRVEVVADEPLHTVHGLSEVIRQGLAVLCAQVSARDRVVAALELRLDLEHGSPERLNLRVTRPTAQVDALLRLLQVHLERLALSSPAITVALWAREVVPTRSEMPDMWTRREAVEPLPELLSRLVDVLGETSVFRAGAVETWRPEASWRPVPAEGAWSPAGADDGDDPVAVQEARCWREPRPRPTQLRSPPLPLRVEAEGGRPTRLRQERGWSAVLRASGPERLKGGWWEKDGGFERDYWVVEVEAGVLWLFEERGQWFVQGWFD